MSNTVPDKENSENEVPNEIQMDAYDLDLCPPAHRELEDERSYNHEAMDVLSGDNEMTDDEAAEQQNEPAEQVYDMESVEDDDPDDLFKPDGTIYLDLDCFSAFCKGPHDVQQRLSKPVYVRGLPWKILAIPREAQRTNARTMKALGFFLQCNGESEANAWTCIASATLKVLSQTEGIQDHSRRISHNFYPKENDWGYSQFLTCDQLLNPENGFIKNDVVRLVVHVNADAPHGVQWDSKKHAGFIGLKNQGATCYMNSILQTFFFTNKLRKAVYGMLTTNDEADENNVALALQRVFYDLQHSDRPVGTKKLTKSFGWDTVESFMQHDVQELCRVLMDNLESKMKGSAVEDTIPNLFKGKMKSFIKCTEVDLESSRVEDFYDIQLNVKGMNDLMESFREYVEVERLDGENKYDAGPHGLQPAEKGVKFIAFPPVLHLQLMRFQYDHNIEANVKINDRFEFPDRLNLNEFAEKGGDGTDLTYCLHAVLVHSGDFHGGHYVVFINTDLTKPKPRWCKFDDDVVSRASVRDAITANYGGEDNEILGRIYTSAYMLVYVRQDCIADVLGPVLESDIPSHLRTRFETERIEEIRKKKEKMEAHLYTEVTMLSESAMMRHHGFDLIDLKQIEEENPKERVEKGMTINELYDFVAGKICKSNGSAQAPNPEHFRIWKFEENTFKDDSSPSATLVRIRPNYLLPYGQLGAEKTLEMALGSERNMLFIEGPEEHLQAYNDNDDMLIFLKYYDAYNNKLTVVGHIMMTYREPLSNYIPQCRALAKLADNVQLRFYEEVAPDRIREVPEHDIPLSHENLLLEVNDGGILIFEIADEASAVNNAKSHLEEMYNRIDVDIVMNTDNFLAGGAEAEKTISATIGLNWSCMEVVKLIGERISYDPEMILLWKMSPYNDRPAVQYLSNEHFKTMRVSDLLGLVGAHTHDPRRHKRYKLSYTKMPIKVVEMEKRRQMKVQLMDEKMNIQEITIFPEKHGTVANILEEASREFPFAPNGTKKLRLVYVAQSVHSMRVIQIFTESTTVQEICQKVMTPAMYMVRVEEIPVDQMVLRPNEHLLPVAHFDKDPNRMFGVPFYFKVQHEESLQSIRDRIQQKLDVSDKEIEKYRFALVIGHRIIRQLDMATNSKVNLSELRSAHMTSMSASPFLGIDHMNKSRASRSTHATEKAIVIHN